MSVICAAPSAIDLAVRFLLSALSWPLHWGFRQPLYFVLVLVPPNITLLSCRFLLRCMLLLLTPVGLRSVQAGLNNTVGRRGEEDFCGFTSGLVPPDVDVVEQGSFLTANNNIDVISPSNSLSM